MVCITEWIFEKNNIKMTFIQRKQNFKNVNKLNIYVVILMVYLRSIIFFRNLVV